MTHFIKNYLDAFREIQNRTIFFFQETVAQNELMFMNPL